MNKERSSEKRIYMNVQGHSVTLNISPNNSSAVTAEKIKQMILGNAVTA